mmetsp:Transcript_38658/g.87823  ORF Transcript_38658/g.87823 Transcript_38658/m.87823 type:complete len:201 (-) Transcript_38658:531-1133(-)
MYSMCTLRPIWLTGHLRATGSLSTKDHSGSTSGQRLSSMSAHLSTCSGLTYSTSPRRSSPPSLPTRTRPTSSVPPTPPRGLLPWSNRLRLCKPVVVATSPFWWTMVQPTSLTMLGRISTQSRWSSWTTDTIIRFCRRRRRWWRPPETRHLFFFSAMAGTISSTATHAVSAPAALARGCLPPRTPWASGLTPRSSSTPGRR